MKFRLVVHLLKMFILSHSRESMRGAESPIWIAILSKMTTRIKAGHSNDKKSEYDPTEVRTRDLRRVKATS